MDLWVVAATAGVGYVAKANYLKNSTSRITESSLKTCSFEVHNHSHSHSHPWNLLQQIRDRTCPLCRLPSLKETATNFPLQRDYTRATGRSITDGELLLQNYGNNKRSDGFNLSNESLPEFLIEECYHAAELYREQSRSEEYVYNPLLSAETYLISRGSHATGKEMDLETQTQQLIPRKSKQHIGMGQTRLSRSSRSLRGSSSDGMLFLFLGITMSMMSNIGDNSREIDKLCELLKQAENLVHELHEELETKDRLTWKELANANEG
ncbi:hypothetical protein GH714_029780 [Hevea brasiliensis]|uniref:Uncharacterized protein n=1 Tax=Hevea brasiliensis TaxID=3981 RepID=A0A6A6L4F7_HEVBR|nr:hypothetical protein GH714_029780 [Hevea brasiliensis]